MEKQEKIRRFIPCSLYCTDKIESWLEEIALKEAMTKLSEREKHIVNLRFFQGKTQMEVADEIGISQAQVSRLEKSALKQIKNHL